MKIKSLIKHNLMRAAMTLALILTCATAWADNDPVSYIAANGSTQTCTDYTMLHTGDNVSNLPGGWYVVSENVEFNSQLYFSGSASIILCDGKTLTVNSGNYNSINVNYALTIYGQSGQSGTLNATCNSGTNSPCIYARNDITINGGIVSVNGAIGIRGHVITINRGTVTSTGNLIGIWATNNVIINGGKVRATGDSYGVMANNNITLGWTNYSDFINANSYYAVDGSVAIATGKTLYDDATAYSGTLTSDQIQAIAGQTLCPYSTNDFTVNTDSTEYTIHTATGWDVFCDALQDNNTWNHFSGKTVKLGADISITQSAGSAGNEFMGTFDGDGKTLTVDITETTTQGTAPFREIKGATIQNLVVTGSVVGTIHAAGLVGFARGADASTVNTITNCKVATNVTVTTPSGNNYHCGGVVGHAFHCTLNMSNTVYCGDITNSGNYVGGLQGWSDGNTIHFSHCLFAGSYSGTTTGTALFHPVAVRYNNSATTADVSHVYYTATPTLTNSNYIAADGTKTTGRTTAPDNLGSQEVTYSFMGMTLYENGLFYNGLYYVAPTLSTDNSGAYLISSVDDWTNFCDMLYDNATWDRFIGKTVKLGANITVTQMAGGSNHAFTGTFDGNHKTLTLNYGTAQAPIDAEFVAPFVEVSGDATFINLNIDGHIYAAYTGSSEPGVGGLIGHLRGGITIEGCTSTVEINSTKDRVGGFVGLCEYAVTFTNCKSSAVVTCTGSGSGFVGWSRDSNYTIAFYGCLFNGKVLKKNGVGSGNGGFVGWKGYHKTVEITNCLVDPAAVAEGETMADDNSATFCRYSADTSLDNQATTITNCYYTETFGNAQGTQAHSITAGNFVTAANAGTATAYATSGITSYGTGIKYNNVLYAGSGESVALTISNTVPASFNFTGYSVTDGASLSGSGNNYTLTMPNAEVDVVITANYTIPSVSYIDENGAAQTCTYYYPLEGTETTLGTAGQETWYVAQPGTLNYSQGIQLLGNTHIILCDGAALNIGTSDSPVSGDGFYCNGVYDLSVYTQSGNTGALAIYSSQYPFVVNNLTLAGGNVNTTSYYDANCNNLTVCRSTLGISASSGSAIYALGDVTFSYVTATTNGSITCANTNFAVDHSQLTVNATNMTAIQTSGGNVTLSYVTADITSSNYQGFYCSSFAVDNSQLTVTAYYEAINALGGVITLGCTAATDFIKATRTDGYINSSYSGTVKIADGQTLYAGTNTYTGTLTDAERQAIGGQKLTNVAPPTYDYIDINGTGATHAAVVIDADNMPTSLSGWYIVQGTVNYTSTINLGGNTHIILADNAVMNVTVTGSNYGIRSVSGNNYSLFVYGQTGQSGELNVTSDRFACYIYGGDITIAGGKVTASGTTGIFALYNNNGGNVTIKNATVTATASYAAIRSYNGGITINNSNVTAMGTARYGIYAEYSGNILLNGGKITATGNNYGIYAENGNITLGWTNPTDYIYANKYSAGGTLSIADNTTFIDEDGNIYNSGTVNASDINGKTLYPYSENAVPYLNENGQQRYCVAYTTLTGTETELGTAGQETWYVVQGTLNYSEGIQLWGNTHLILADGAALNIGTSDSPVSGDGFYCNGVYDLSLYAQSGNTGALTIYSQSSSFVVKDLTIAGGNVNATSRSNVTVIGCTNNLTVCRSSLEIHTNGPAVQANDVTLSNVTANINSSNSVGFVCSNFAVDNSQLTVNTRGEAIGANNGIILSNVTANLNSSNAVGLICSNFAVDNSQLTVTAPNPAIQASNVITLGCTAATDFIKATSTNSLPDSYIGTVKIADGQTLYAGTNAYTGTLTDAQRQAIGGQKLTNVAPPTYDYIDLDGTGATHTAVVINADNMPTALSGWYIVQGTVNYTNTINLGGDTHIILADNAVMNVTVGGNHGIRSTSGNNYSFFVYGQTGQSGELNVTSNSYACFISGGDITIAGGKVTASGSTGIFAQYNNNGGNVTIKNATVTATASYAAIRSINGDITIDNSNVTATRTGNDNYRAFYSEGGGNIIFRNGGKTRTERGIYCGGDVTIEGGQVEIYGRIITNNITLGWTNPTDYIYANSYYAGGTLSIADGKAFIDEDGQTYSGIIAMENGAYAIDGKTLYPNCVVRKQVAGYGEGNGGWVFIASPVAGSIAPSEVHNLLGSYDEATGKYDYDLYRFNQSDANGKEWQNWNATTTENHPDFTSLVNGHGYLYATKETRTLVFAGEYTAATAPVEVPLDYDENAQLKGWNLVGNPFTTQATMTDENGQPVSFYVINGQNVVPYEGSAATIEPCTGVMVKAEGTGEKVRFTKVTPDIAPQPNNGSLQIALSQVHEPVEGPARNDNAYSGVGFNFVESSISTSSTTLIDNAIISFNEGSKLSKFYFGTQNANIYIPQGQEEYAIAYSKGQGEMPLNFKAIENGTYTLTISPTLNSKLSTLNYLHLIDNMTGADVDLLAANGGDARPCVSTYTFTAKTTDYESRFKLVFAVGSTAGSDTFAFISNGNIIVNGEGMLQVIDMTGRVLYTAEANSAFRIQHSAFPTPGVYVLRLINGENVRTQKIVVE